MTISSSTSKNQYTANGVNTEFTYTFKIFDEDDIKVILTDTSDVEEVQVITTDYTVSGVGNDGGGAVTFVSVPTLNYTVTLKRNEPLLQDIDYVDGDDFPAAAHEEGLDRSCIRDQFLQEQINRALLLPESTTFGNLTIADPTGEAGKYLIVNDDEDGFDYAAITGTLDGVAIVSGDSQKPIRVNAGETGFEVSSAIELSQINDSNGNEEIIFTTTASAVNELTVANAATGNNPSVSATGGDANIGVNIQPKGTGALNILGTSTSAAQVRLFEDTDNGTNYTGIKAASSIASNYTLTLPNALPVSTSNVTVDSSGNVAFSSSSGVVLQTVTSLLTTAASTTTAIPNDDTIPQNTEGAEYTTLAITPQSASSTLEITVQMTLAVAGSGEAVVAALFVDSTADALAVGAASPASNITETVSYVYRVASGSTSARTYKVRYGCGTATAVTVNGTGGARKYGGVLQSGLIIKEIL